MTFVIDLRSLLRHPAAVDQEVGAGHERCALRPDVERERRTPFEIAAEPGPYILHFATNDGVGNWLKQFRTQ